MEDNKEKIEEIKKRIAEWQEELDTVWNGKDTEEAKEERRNLINLISKSKQEIDALNGNTKVEDIKPVEETIDNIKKNKELIEKEKKDVSREFHRLKNETEKLEEEKKIYESKKNPEYEGIYNEYNKKINELKKEADKKAKRLKELDKEMDKYYKTNLDSILRSLTKGTQDIDVEIKDIENKIEQKRDEIARIQYGEDSALEEIDLPDGTKTKVPKVNRLYEDIKKLEEQLNGKRDSKENIEKLIEEVKGEKRATNTKFSSELNAEVTNYFHAQDNMPRDTRRKKEELVEEQPEPETPENEEPVEEQPEQETPENEEPEEEQPEQEAPENEEPEEENIDYDKLTEEIYPYALKNIVLSQWDSFSRGLSERIIFNYSREHDLDLSFLNKINASSYLFTKMINEEIINVSGEFIKDREEIIEILKSMGIELSPEEMELLKSQERRTIRSYGARRPYEENSNDDLPDPENDEEELEEDLPDPENDEEDLEEDLSDPENDEDELENDDDEDKKKPGFFKRLFNKIKEVIKKVVTKVKNGFKKLTTKQVEALDSAEEEELEEDLEDLELDLEGLEGELTADDIREAVEKEEKHRGTLREDIDVRDDKDVMDGIHEAEERVGKEEDAGIEESSPKQNENENEDLPSWLHEIDDKENEGEEH